VRGGRFISYLRLSQNQRYEFLIKVAFYRDLKKDVLFKLSCLRQDDVKRLILAWRAVEDCLLVSSPELVNKPLTKLQLDLWRWTISTIVHSYDEFAKKWKAVTLHFKHAAANSPNRLGNPFPRGVPGGTNGTAGKIWFDTLPWLSGSMLSQFGKLSDRDFYQRIGTLCQTRNLPPPPLSENRWWKEVREWVGYLTRKQEWNPILATRVETALEKILKFYAGREIHKRPHISLNASGCLGNPREKGGRVIDFLKKFLDRYVRCSQTVNRKETTWFGAPYWTIAGYPAAYTMCRVNELDERIKWYLSSAFRSEWADGTPISVMIGGEDAKIAIEEAIFGLDRELPLQFLQCAIEDAIKLGYLKGKPWYTPLEIERATKKPVIARAHCVSEPGNKVRWVTMEDSSIGIILQPLAHWMASVFGQYPALWSAFNRTYKMWDACVSLQRNGKFRENSGFGVFDLTGASNNLNKEFLRVIGQWAIRNFESDPQTQWFLSTSLELMLRDREIWLYDQKDSKRVLTIICTNGIMMGNPGTKELLCMANAVCHVIAAGELNMEIPYCLIAGDDVFVYASLKFFLYLLDVHREMGNLINISKTLFSFLCTFFCEEVAILLRAFIGCGKSPWEEGGTDGLHVDTIKLRLLSPFGVQSIQQESSFKNPAIGKAGALSRVFSWFPNDRMKWVAVRRYLHWMSDYIRDDPLVYLPRTVGGHGIPWIGEKKDLLRLIRDKIPSEYFRMFSMVSDGEADYHSFIDFLFRRMASGNTVRGILDPMSYLLTAQYSALAVTSFYSDVKVFRHFAEELQSKKTYTVSSKDILKYIRSSGYMGYHDIANHVDRLTMIRIGFVAAAGHMPMEDFIPKRDKSLPTPQEVLTRFVDEESKKLHIGGFSWQDLEPRTQDYLRFREWFLGDMKPFVLREKQLFVPQRAVGDSLAGMSIPLPYRPPPEPVKGSTADAGVDPEIEGYIAKVVSLSRVN
jgi:hypothetical protein